MLLFPSLSAPYLMDSRRDTPSDMVVPIPIRLNFLKSYLTGAMHDGTVRKWTLRISQKEEEYVLLLKELILDAGARAWTYREGRDRNLYVVEFARVFLNGHESRTKGERLHYIRGYFDAEGSVASPAARDPYVYFAQKNRSDLEHVRGLVVQTGVSCGKLHNPSRLIDPEYWRFFIARSSLLRFADVVGSWHPRKRLWLNELSSRTEQGRMARGPALASGRVDRVLDETSWSPDFSRPTPLRPPAP